MSPTDVSAPPTYYWHLHPQAQPCWQRLRKNPEVPLPPLQRRSPPHNIIRTNSQREHFQLATTPAPRSPTTKWRTAADPLIEVCRATHPVGNDGTSPSNTGREGSPRTHSSRAVLPLAFSNWDPTLPPHVLSHGVIYKKRRVADPLHWNEVPRPIGMT